MCYTTYMADLIKPELTKAETEALLRFLPLVFINIELNPEQYNNQSATDLKSAFEKIDKEVHETAKWCDKSDCPYYKRKQRREEKEATQN